MTELLPRQSDPRGLASRFLRSDFLKRLSITVSTGGLTFGIATFTHQRSVDSFILTVLVAGITILVQYLIEVESQLNYFRANQNDSMVKFGVDQEARFAKYGEGLDLISAIEGADEDSGLMRRIIFASVDRNIILTPLARALRKASLQSVVDDLSGLVANQTIRYDGEDRDRLLSLTRAAVLSIDAITVTAFGAASGFDEGYWMSDLGARYVQAQDLAIHDPSTPVRIRRLFTYDDPAILSDPAFRAQCLSHDGIGADVRVLDETIQLMHVRLWIKDIAIFDDHALYEATSLRGSSQGRRSVETRITFERDRVMQHLDQFRSLWANADRPDFLPAQQVAT